MALKPYMGYAGEPEDGACLIFAHTAKEAKKIGWPVIGGWFSCAEYVDMRVSLIKDEDHLFKEADKARLDANIPHVIEEPRCCKYCEKWGIGEIGEDGLCPDCHLDKERDALALKNVIEAIRLEYAEPPQLPQTHPSDSLMDLPYELR